MSVRPTIKIKGRLIGTRSGKFGVLLSKAGTINGQLPFILTDEKFKPILDKKKQLQRLLVKPENITTFYGWQD